MKQYRDMSCSEMLDWGITETRLRQADLRDVNSLDALQTAQANAKARRKAIGASAAAASAMVIEANRHLRRVAHEAELAKVRDGAQQIVQALRDGEAAAKVTS